MEPLSGVSRIKVRLYLLIKIFTNLNMQQQQNCFSVQDKHHYLYLSFFHLKRLEVFLQNYYLQQIALQHMHPNQRHCRKLLILYVVLNLDLFKFKIKVRQKNFLEYFCKHDFLFLTSRMGPPPLAFIYLSDKTTDIQKIQEVRQQNKKELVYK